MIPIGWLIAAMALQAAGSYTQHRAQQAAHICSIDINHLEKVMINMKKEIARYQVFITGDIQCVQDSIGYWRTVSKNDSGKWEIRISKSRPAIFKEFRILTREQMEWDAFSQGYPIFYVPDRTVAEARTFQEAADIFRKQMTDLNELGKVGLK